MVFRLGARLKLLAYSAVAMLVFGGLVPLATTSAQAAEPVVYGGVTVLDSAGEPFIGGEAWIYTPDSGAFVSGILDSDGRTSFDDSLPFEPALAYLSINLPGSDFSTPYTWDGSALVEDTTGVLGVPILFGASGIDLEAVLPLALPPILIKGKVTDSGGGALGKVHVGAYDMQGLQKTWAVSAADGMYVFRDLPDGNYSLLFQSHSANSSNPFGFIPSWYGDDFGTGLPIPVMVAGGQVSTANEVLSGKGRVSGSISELTPDGAIVPVVGSDIAVVAFLRGKSLNDPSVVFSHSTEGKYDLDLAPGSYTVAFGNYTSGTAMNSFVPRQYFDRVDAVATSTAVEVTAATSVGGVNAIYGVSGGGVLVPGVVSISGSPRVGSTLSAVTGTWVPAGVGFEYQWIRGAAAISGATAATYRPVAADVGKTISVRVTGSKTGYVVMARDSLATAPVSASGTTSEPAVERLAGADRFGTSAAISAASFPVGVPVAYVANGMNFPDALSGAAAAGAAKGPVLLVSAGSIPAAVQAELRRLKPARIVVLGGEGVVQKSVATSLKVFTSGSVTRVAGTDRFSTSAAISKASFSVGPDVVYIADGMNFPDALSGAAVAGSKSGPVLLVSSTSIPAVVKTELNRLKPKKIVVLGGVGAVSALVVTELKGYTTGAVTRLAGPDRFSTSAAISQASFPARTPVVFVANGMNFPDALSGAAVAGVKGGPVLLVSATSIPAAVQAELVRLKPARIVVLGGDGVISPAVQALLASYAGN